jgi:hypothetical protein
MKRALPFPPPRPRLPLVPLGLATSLLLAPIALALTTDNPYSAIASRNAFALKPPVVATNTPTTPVIAPAGIELQGIHTILGKAQVFLKIKLPPRPPKPAEDQSVVLEAGQREGDVEVISIDPAAGVVRLRNRGDELALNMIDNAATPTAAPIAAPALPGLTLPRPPGLPAPAGVIPRPTPTVPAPGGVSTTIGGNPVANTAAAANSMSMPTRNIRSGLNSAGTAGAAGTAQTARPVRELTAEEGAALLEINRKANEGRGLPFPPPRVNLNE